jgi:hypothetical protein
VLPAPLAARMGRTADRLSLVIHGFPEEGRPGDAGRCKAVRSGARLIWMRTGTTRVGANTTVALLFIGACPPYPGGRDEHSHAVRSCRRRNAAARSRPHCRQRHRCSDRSIRRLSGVSGCPLPQWVGISSLRTLRRSTLGKWTIAVLLVASTPPLPTNRTWDPEGPVSEKTRLGGVASLTCRAVAGREDTSRPGRIS